jgi:hypothetical protein
MTTGAYGELLELLFNGELYEFDELGGSRLIGGELLEFECVVLRWTFNVFLIVFLVLIET